VSGGEKKKGSGRKKIGLRLKGVWRQKEKARNGKVFRRAANKADRAPKRRERKEVPAPGQQKLGSQDWRQPDNRKVKNTLSKGKTFPNRNPRKTKNSKLPIEK